VFNEVNVHTAASVVIARELGIKVSDERGQEVAWSAEPPTEALTGDLPGALIVAWPRIHAALLDALGV
jgi:fructose-1,6-bisphosphatase/inositol monophosphatase family enzyme